MFKEKEIKAETIEKILELDKRDLELFLYQLKGAVSAGLENEDITALTIANIFRKVARGVSHE